jgi:hypothetical protein
VVIRDSDMTKNDKKLPRQDRRRSAKGCPHP